MDRRMKAGRLARIERGCVYIQILSICPS